jgi:hypothetical protein
VKLWLDDKDGNCYQSVCFSQGQLEGLITSQISHRFVFHILHAATKRVEKHKLTAATHISYPRKTLLSVAYETGTWTQAKGHISRLYI